MDGAHDYHDFRSKLLQRSAWSEVQEYVRWQQATRIARSEAIAPPPPPELVPLSINLDLTTACNYQCDHCIDWDILNSGQRHREDKLRESLHELASRGTKSVILIGGGEPTIYPRFVQIVEYLKELGLQVAIVSNGSRGDRLLEAAPCFSDPDWIRLSLDAGTDATFQAMHKPRQPISLDEICSWVPKIKKSNAQVKVGYSFIVTWRGATREEVPIVENIDELVLAAKRARDYQFDYLSVKPFLMRQEENGAEVMNPGSEHHSLDTIVRKIRAAIEDAKMLENESFKVVESTNLKLLEQKTWKQHTHQPRQCHMQALRQVLTPLGVFNCPGYRGVPHGRIEDSEAYCDSDAVKKTVLQLSDMLDQFDASEQCANVTCLYHSTNWWLQELIDRPEELEKIEPTDDTTDFFL